MHLEGNVHLVHTTLHHLSTHSQGSEGLHHVLCYLATIDACPWNVLSQTATEHPLLDGLAVRPCIVDVFKPVLVGAQCGVENLEPVGQRDARVVVTHNIMQVAAHASGHVGQRVAALLPEAHDLVVLRTVNLHDASGLVDGQLHTHTTCTNLQCAA